jgi:hypothetical protein
MRSSQIVLPPGFINLIGNHSEQYVRLVWLVYHIVGTRFLKHHAYRIKRLAHWEHNYKAQWMAWILRQIA